MSRLPASRWARIGAWTGAAVAWGTTMVVVREAAPADAGEADSPPETTPAVEEMALSAGVPSMPEDGLVILRYTPIPDPQPKVITRYVTVTVPVGGGSTTVSSGASRSSASSPAPSTSTGGGGGGGSTVAPPPPPPPAPTPTTAPPAPVSGGS